MLELAAASLAADLVLELAAPFAADLVLCLVRSLPAANPTRPPRDELHDEEQKRRSAECDEDQPSVTSERYTPTLGVKDHAADEGAYNTDDDVRHHARAATADQLGSEPAGDQSDEKPDDYDFQRHNRS
jgi:hypothetical protein